MKQDKRPKAHLGTYPVPMDEEALRRLDVIAEQLQRPRTEVIRAFVLPEVGLADPMCGAMRDLARTIAHREFGVAEPIPA